MIVMPNSISLTDQPESFFEQFIDFPAFTSMTQLEIKSFIEAHHGVCSTYSKGEIIGLEGDPISGIGILISGTASVIKENPSGERLRIAHLKTGDVFGEVAVYTCDFWTATVLSEEMTEVLMISRMNLLPSEMQSNYDAKFQLNMLRIVSRKALNLNQKLEILSMRSLRKKIVKFLAVELERQGKNPMVLRMNREEMAEFLQVSRPALSRELMRLKKESLLEFEGRVFYIPDFLNLMKELK